MASIQSLYIKGVRKQLGDYFAAWMPNAELKLGDVGELVGPVFTRTTSLEDLGVPFTTRPDASATPVSLVSSSGVSFAFKASGEISRKLPEIPQAEGGIEVRFGGKGAFVVQAPTTFEPAIEDIHAVDGAIRELDKAGGWDKKWAVITQIVECPVATILVSQSRNAALQLAAKCPGTPTIEWLGKLGGELSVSSQKGAMVRFIGAKAVTPFFQLRKLRVAQSGGAVRTRNQPGFRSQQAFRRTGLRPAGPASPVRGKPPQLYRMASQFRPGPGNAKKLFGRRSVFEPGSLSLQPLQDSDVDWT